MRSFSNLVMNLVSPLTPILNKTIRLRCLLRFECGFWFKKIIIIKTLCRKYTTMKWNKTPICNKMRSKIYSKMQHHILLWNWNSLLLLLFFYLFCFGLYSFTLLVYWVVHSHTFDIWFWQLDHDCIGTCWVVCAHTVHNSKTGILSIHVSIHCVQVQGSEGEKTFKQNIKS